MSEIEFNPEFVSRMIPKLEWAALVQAAEGVRHNYNLFKMHKYQHFLKNHVHRTSYRMFGCFINIHLQLYTFLVCLVTTYFFLSWAI